MSCEYVEGPFTLENLLEWKFHLQRMLAVPVPVFVATACGDVDAACDADIEDDGVVSRHTYKQCARLRILKS